MSGSPVVPRVNSSSSLSSLRTVGFPGPEGSQFEVLLVVLLRLVVLLVVLLARLPVLVVLLVRPVVLRPGPAPGRGPGGCAASATGSHGASASGSLRLSAKSVVSWASHWHTTIHTTATHKKAV